MEMEIAKNKIEKTIDQWVDFLDLYEWTIFVKEIEPKSVTYDNSCPDEDRYFIGIEADHKDKIATLYHDRDLTERDIIHELLHVRNPSWSEDRVCQMEENLYYKYTQNKDL